MVYTQTGIYMGDQYYVGVREEIRCRTELLQWMRRRLGVYFQRGKRGSLAPIPFHPIRVDSVIYHGMRFDHVTYDLLGKTEFIHCVVRRHPVNTYLTWTVACVCKKSYLQYLHLVTYGRVMCGRRWTGSTSNAFDAILIPVATSEITGSGCPAPHQVHYTGQLLKYSAFLSTLLSYFTAAYRVDFCRNVVWLGTSWEYR